VQETSSALSAPRWQSWGLRRNVAAKPRSDAFERRRKRRTATQRGATVSQSILQTCRSIGSVTEGKHRARIVRLTALMKTEELMTRNVAACRPDDSLEQAARLMWDRDVGCVVVTDGHHKPIGMITDRDLAMAAYTQGALLRDIRVETVMARKLWACSVNSSLKEIEDKMRTAQVRRLPVVGFDGELVGIVALGDIARSAQSSPLRLTELPGLASTLASITERRWPESAAAQ